MMHALNVFHIGGTWLALDGSRLVTLPAFPMLELPTVVVSDFNHALTGVMAMDANPSMAAPLIERRLRTEGMVEGETRLEVSHTVAVGRGFQALYSAMPMSDWQRMVSWANGSRDHCLVLPLLSVAKRLLKPDYAIVLRHGRQVTFLSITRDSILHAETMAYSDDNDGVQASVGALSDRVRALLAKGNRPRGVAWFALQSAAGLDEAALAADFARSVGLDVQMGAHQTLTLPDGSTCLSALPRLVEALHVRDAASSKFSSLLFRAERALPLAAAASAVLAVGLLAVGWMSHNQAATRTTQAEELRNESERVATESRAQLAALEVSSASADETRRFVERLAQASDAPDMGMAMSSVSRAAQGWVRILRLRLGETDRQLYVEGAIAKGPRGAQDLSLFIANLRSAGFDPVAADPPPGTQSADYFSYALLPQRPAQTGAL